MLSVFELWFSKEVPCVLDEWLKLGHMSVLFLFDLPPQHRQKFQLAFMLELYLLVDCCYRLQQLGKNH